MNAIDALKLANTRGSAAMVHARELSIRRQQLSAKIAGAPPLVLIGAGLGAGALLGKLANRHPIIASLTTGVAALLRYAPADMLMQLWEQRTAEGAEAAVAATAPPPVARATQAGETHAPDLR